MCIFIIIQWFLSWYWFLEIWVSGSLTFHRIWMQEKRWQLTWILYSHMLWHHTQQRSHRVRNNKSCITAISTSFHHIPPNLRPPQSLPQIRPLNLTPSPPNLSLRVTKLSPMDLMNKEMPLLRWGTYWPLSGHRISNWTTNTQYSILILFSFADWIESPLWKQFSFPDCY